MSYITNKFEDISFSFIEEPIEVKPGEEKPFDIYVNDKLLYSNITPIDGEKGPILFETSKWWGEPVQSHLDRIESEITSSENK